MNLPFPVLLSVFVFGPGNLAQARFDQLFELFGREVGAFGVGGGEPLLLLVAYLLRCQKMRPAQAVVLGRVLAHVPRLPVVFVRFLFGRVGCLQVALFHAS